MTCALNVAMPGCGSPAPLAHDTLRVEYTITANPTHTTYYGTSGSHENYTVYPDLIGYPPIVTGSPAQRPVPASPPWLAGGVLCCDAGTDANGATRAILWTGSAWVLRYYCQLATCDLSTYEDIPLVTSKSRLCPPNILLWFEGDTAGAGGCGVAGVHVVAKATDACVIALGRYPAVPVGAVANRRRDGRAILALDACDCRSKMPPLPTCYPNPCWWPPPATLSLTLSGFPDDARYISLGGSGPDTPVNGHSLILDRTCGGGETSYTWRAGQAGLATVTLFDASTVTAFVFWLPVLFGGVIVWNRNILSIGWDYHGEPTCGPTIQASYFSTNYRNDAFLGLVQDCNYSDPVEDGTPIRSWVFDANGWPCDFTTGFVLTWYRLSEVASACPAVASPFTGVVTFSP